MEPAEQPLLVLVQRCGAQWRCQYRIQIPPLQSDQMMELVLVELEWALKQVEGYRPVLVVKARSCAEFAVLESKIEN